MQNINDKNNMNKDLNKKSGSDVRTPGQGKGSDLDKDRSAQPSKPGFDKSKDLNKQPGFDKRK